MSCPFKVEVPRQSLRRLQDLNSTKIYPDTNRYAFLSRYVQNSCSGIVYHILGKMSVLFRLKTV